MAQKESALFAVTPGSLSGLAVIFLLLAAFFALLNGQKVKALRANVATPRASVPAKVNASTGGTTGAQPQGKTADTGRSSRKSRSSTRRSRERKSRSQRQTRRQPAGNCSVTPTRGGNGNELQSRPRPAPRRQLTMRRAAICNRKSMTFGVSSMALRKKKRC